MQANIAGPPKSTVEHFMAIVRAEGWQGLYRGVGPTTQRAIIITASQLASYDHAKQSLIRSGVFEEGILLHFACSIVSGLVCATTTAPIDLLKSRYMNQKFIAGKGVAYSSTLDCLRKTIRTDGVPGLWKGWAAQWTRMAPHTIITFVVFEQLRRAAGMSPV
ncbi:mitochondrial substrate carrier family protein-like protein [Blyttiomyces helicus]|uniref:Mitochondrial substrate carrier family protein-like protein n=1 Tax=Blyttiomyces helicus TaxID=388810 RepID=A0A4P9W464_9FUNG|nr:mitochondrial substrate carrier family protein-like protein [Blyttiomyces helicus]|eukprot:RKO85628.1 mitochondrial substrate carrier family protein-like protein [Blyttiomyces helicus]